MSLPAAPLGQLPTMNLPYSRPFYAKDSITMKALGAFLSGLAQGVGQQATSNLMSRDYSTEPASFWSKLVSGPKESAAMFEQQAGRDAAAAALDKQLQAAATQGDLNRGMDVARMSLAERQGAATRTMQRELSGQDFNKALVLAGLGAKNQRDLASINNQGRLDAIEREYGFRGKQATSDFNNSLLLQKQINQAKLDAIDETYLQKARLQEAATQRMLQMLNPTAAGGGSSPMNSTPSSPTLTPAEQAALQGSPPLSMNYTKDAYPQAVMQYYAKSTRDPAVLAKLQEMLTRDAASSTPGTDNVLLMLKQLAPQQTASPVIDAYNMGLR